MLWLYRSPIGNIYIQQLSDGRFGMLYNNVVWESCNSPQAEADNIYMQCTGCYEWDSFDGSNINIPTDLSEWTRIR